MEEVGIFSERNYNIIIIGCGKIVENSHLPTILKSGRAKIIALIDKNTENAFRLKKKYSIDCQIAEDISLIEEKIDVAIIATPNNTHYPIARDCLERNISVLIEKPMCIKSREAIELCSLAKEKKLFISVSYWTRYLENISLMKELLETNYFGKILSYEFEFGTPGGWAPLSGYSINSEQSGGGVLMINGTHIIDRLLYWFGEPDSFEYEDDSHGGVEANCKAKFLYRNGLGEFSGSIFLSKTVSLKNRTILNFETSVCEIKEGQDEPIRVYPKQDKNIQYEISRGYRTKEKVKNPFDVQFDNFIECIEGCAQPTVDGNFAKKSVLLIEKMYNKTKQINEPWIIRI
jgi:predicted dehydrogenase